MGSTSPHETLMSESGRAQKVPEGGEGAEGSVESVRKGKKEGKKRRRCSGTREVGRAASLEVE